MLDASLHLGPCFEAKGEYIRTCYGSDDLGFVRPNGWWVQMVTSWPDWIWSCRESTTWNSWAAMTSCTTGWEPQPAVHSRVDVYYITNTLLFEGDYEFINSKDPSAGQPIDFAAFVWILERT